jgi:hypothetical protein
MAAIEPRAALTPASTLSRGRQTAHFVRHYLEMCAPMCIGFAVGDLVYFWAAGRFGYSEPSATCLSCRCSSSPSR